MFSISLLIIITTVLVSLKGFSDLHFFEKYKFNISAVKYGQHYRMISSGFLHGDYMHLFFNMFSFWSFSSVLENTFSPINVALLYFGSMALGSWLTYLIHKEDYHYSAIGASGAVSGAIYSAVLLYPDIKMLVLFIPMPGYMFAILYLLYSIYGMRNKIDNIGHTAHFGGALGGLIFTLIKFPELFIERKLLIVILLIPVLFLYYLIKSRKI